MYNLIVHKSAIKRVLNLSKVKSVQKTTYLDKNLMAYYDKNDCILMIKSSR